MSGETSLYERLGGEEAVEAAVEIFYRNVLEDDRISHFFDDVDLREQIAKQKSFLTMVFGGPADYDGRELREAHRDIGPEDEELGDEHVDAVLEALDGALEELDVPEAERSEVLEIAESVRPEVLDR